METGFALGIAEEVWGGFGNAVLAKTGFDPRGGDDDWGRGNGADKVLRADDFGRGEVGAG